MSERDLLDPIIADILTKLNEEPYKRYQDLKDHLNISDATLSKKMNLLRAHQIIQASSTNNVTGRNYIVYSLTEKGKEMERLINEYLEQVNTEVEV